jgi:molybdopterin converting factor small subunit
MQIRVKAFPILQDEIILNVKPNTTLRQLLNTLTNQKTALKNLIFTREGVLNDEILILHNGANIRNLDTQLAEGDLIIIIQPIIGG